MELNVENKKEAEVRKEIQNILEEENKRRGNVSAAGVEDQSGEAGIFCISKSELLENAKDYIQGNRIIFGSISIVLLMAGVTNYLNIVVTGIFSRKKELEIMESVGMTKRQKRMLFMMEGGYYFCAVTVLLVTIGSVMLQWIKTYMETKLSYFVFQLRFPQDCICLKKVTVNNNKKGRRIYMFERIDYRVIRIDGEYAYLQKLEDENAEEKCVAMALLPPEIQEGCHIAYEMMEYRMIK